MFEVLLSRTLFSIWNTMYIFQIFITMPSVFCHTATQSPIFFFSVVEDINKKREPISSLEAIYLISPVEKVRNLFHWMSVLVMCICMISLLSTFILPKQKSSLMLYSQFVLSLMTSNTPPLLTKRHTSSSRTVSLFGANKCSFCISQVTHAVLEEPFLYLCFFSNGVSVLLPQPVQMASLQKLAGLELPRLPRLSRKLMWPSCRMSLR